MEAALSWIGQIFDFLFSLLPTPIICRTTHEGVKFAAGDQVKVIRHDNGILWPYMVKKWFPVRFRNCGIHFYWPLTTQYELVPIKRQTTNLVAQYLCTADNKTVGASGIFVYEVADVEKLLTECFDYEDTIRDIALSCIKSVIVQHDQQYLLENSDALDKELTKVLREQLRRFGIKTVRCTLTDFTQCKVLAHWGFDVSVNNGYTEQEE